MEVGIFLHELGNHAVGIAQHILIDQHLTIAAVTSTNTNGEGIRLLGDELGQGCRYALECDGKGASLSYGLSILDQLLGLLQRLALYLITA